MDLATVDCCGTNAIRYFVNEWSSTAVDCICYCCCCCWLLSTMVDWWWAMEFEYTMESVKHCDDWMERGFVVVNELVVVLCYSNRWCLSLTILNYFVDREVLSFGEEKNKILKKRPLYFFKFINWTYRYLDLERRSFHCWLNFSFPSACVFGSKSISWGLDRSKQVN